MEQMDIDPILIAWVRNFLTGRKQRVKIGKFVPVWSQCMEESLREQSWAQFCLL